MKKLHTDYLWGVQPPFSSEEFVFPSAVYKHKDQNNNYNNSGNNRLCGLVVIVSGYESRGPGFNSWRFQIF
jgi:hypothetical protein